MVRGRQAQEAIEFLMFTPKRSAKPLLETIKSAVANAEQNFKQQRKNLYIKSIIVNEGVTLKRQMPVSRGRSHPINKRSSHITVEVGVRETESNKEKVATKKAAKTSEKSTKLTPKS